MPGLSRYTELPELSLLPHTLDEHQGENVSTLTEVRKDRSMAHVQDVARYILEKRGRMSAMKLQKLVYYSQGWHLVFDGEPLFAERIEAWANGPVVPARQVERLREADHRRRTRLIR